jgi:hypothetical protein
MGPHSQLSGGNGGHGALCHMKKSVLVPRGHELCPMKGLLSGEVESLA